MIRIFITMIFSITSILLYSHVNLIYPEGGEVFDPGEEVLIEWEEQIPHDTENWDLYFSDDGGVIWQELQLDIHPDTLHYLWIVPDNATTMGRIKVVQDNVGTDYEDASGNFTITMPVGLTERSDQDEIKIYPNPAGEFIFIETIKEDEIKELRIYNSFGSSIMLPDQHLYFDRRDHGRISLAGLKPGVYFLSIMYRQRTFVEKIVVY